jgi:two-component system, LytTR family, response regulator
MWRLRNMKTLIVDPEPSGRAVLRRLCEDDGSIEEVVVAENGAAAIEMIRSNSPDLLLLDVELNDMSGLEVLRSLRADGRPAVIMVATNQKHACEALRGGAIDYLTKPVAARRFATALAKVHERHEHRLAPVKQQMSRTVDTGPLQTSVRLIAENAHKLYFLAAQEIDYIESCGDYVLIHVGDQKYIRRDTLKRLATALRNLEFEWIRRSVLVNISRVSFAEKVAHGALAFTLSSGVRLVSRKRVKLQCTRIPCA